MRNFVSLSFALFLLTGAARSATPAYDLLDLGPVSDDAVALNAMGQTAFVREGRVLRYTDSEGYQDISPSGHARKVGGINAHGQVSAAVDRDDGLDILLYSDGRGWELKSYLPVDSVWSAPGRFVGPNDHGDLAVAQGILGEYISETGRHGIGFPGWPALNVVLMDINNRGEAVYYLYEEVHGYPAGSVRYTDPGHQEQVGVPLPYALNDRGDILGDVILRPDGSALSYRAIDAGNAVPRDLNDMCAVIGNSYIGNQPDQPWLAMDGEAWSLETLVDPSLGWHLTWANSINNAGQIAGVGVLNGERHAFRLTPTAIPEPGTLALLGIGLLPLARRRRH